MPPAVVAAIPAIMAVVSTGVQIANSTGGPHNTYPDSMTNPKPVVPTTDTKGLTTDPQTAAAITARLAQMQSQAGPGGFAPGFYEAALNSQYPGFDQMVQQIVAQKVGG